METATGCETRIDAQVGSDVLEQPRRGPRVPPDEVEIAVDDWCDWFPPPQLATAAAGPVGAEAA